MLNVDKNNNKKDVAVENKIVHFLTFNLSEFKWNNKCVSVVC